MKVLKHELFLCFAITALVALCALAWGSPFVGAISSSSPVLAQSQQPPAVFQGTVLRNGEQFVLRAASGAIYRLDDPQRAQAFEGKAVTVTGKLDAQGKTIHVERIEPAA